MEKYNLLRYACVTGFLGDAGLQFLTKSAGMGGSTGWGLKGYFAQHGATESLFIAGGMLTLFFTLYLMVLPPNPYYLLIYGVLLDLLFREWRLFPSLSGYYTHLNYFWSAVWGAIPMLLPWILTSMRV